MALDMLCTVASLVNTLTASINFDAGNLVWKDLRKTRAAIRIRMWSVAFISRRALVSTIDVPISLLVNWK